VTKASSRLLVFDVLDLGGVDVKLGGLSQCSHNSREPICSSDLILLYLLSEENATKLVERRKMDIHGVPKDRRKDEIHGWPSQQSESDHKSSRFPKRQDQI
jgi:hypothetical protein